MLAIRAFACSLAAVGLLACGATTTYMQIRNPIVAGAVDSNRIPVEEVHDERRLRLPAGTLVDEARLVTLTPQRICIHVNVWSIKRAPQRSNLRTYHIALLNDSSDVENSTVQIQLEAPTTVRLAGGRRGRRFYQVTRQPALLCFPNGGFVTPSTTHLTLELSGPANRSDFEWDFLSEVASTPAGSGGGS